MASRTIERAMGTPAIFLDRDGTLSRPPAGRYLTSASDFQLLPGAAAGAATLARAGFALVIVSNQQGVALGVVTPAVLKRIAGLVQVALAEHGCHIEMFMYCLHSATADCACRKPRPGMLQEAARIGGFDLSASWMVGDRQTDVSAGAAAGCRTVLIARESAHDVGDSMLPTLRAPSLRAAAEGILARR